MLSPLERDCQLNAGTQARRGSDDDLASKLRCSQMHIAQALSVPGSLRWQSSDETAPIVANLAAQFVASDGKAELHATGVSVTRSVIDSFFEDQEEVTALLGVELDLIQPGRDFEVPIDAAHFEHVRGELAYSDNNVAQI